MIVRLDESNKNNEFFRNQFSSQDEKMKSLGQKLAEAEAKIENLSYTKLAIETDLFLLSLKKKFISLPSRGIIEKMLILLGSTKIKVLM